MGMRRLDCAVQTYKWGRKGKDSLVARLKMSDNPNFDVDEEETYAEMWLGTHPKGPCRVYPDDDNIMENSTKMHLIDLLHKDKKLRGDNRDLDDIPFMLKILSIGKALSIQAHPDTLNSRRLYSVRPDLYKDSTHKPEMSIALTTVETICGFRPFHEIVYFLQCYPELRSMVSSKALRVFMDAPRDEESRQKAFKMLFNDYVTTRENVASKQTVAMINRLRSMGRRRREQNGEVVADDKQVHAQEDQQKAERLCLVALGEEIGEIESRRIVKSLRAMDSHIQGVILRLAEQYPGDIGLMMPLMLNYLKLKPGQSFYTAPNVPHCYISGETIEVMALSDNVVRLGFTPKHKDIPVLREILTYKMGPPHFIEPTCRDDTTACYTPPIVDFEVELMTIKVGSTYCARLLTTPSLMLCISGQGTSCDGTKTIELRPGVACFIPPNCAVKHTAAGASTPAHNNTENGEPLVLALVHSNTIFKEGDLKVNGST